MHGDDIFEEQRGQEHQPWQDFSRARDFHKQKQAYIERESMFQDYVQNPR
jgi:hypothetical protein